MNSYDFSGRTALVTGGASGLGAAAAEAIRSGGGTVAILDLDVGGCAAPAVAADVSDEVAVATAVADVERELGHIDVLVHSAGIGGPWGGLLDLDGESWRRVMDVNANGTFHVCRAVVPGMVARGYGRVVLLSSIAGREGHMQLPAYAASKAAIIAVAKSLGRELASTGVVVNVVTPAAIATPLSTNLDEETQRRMVASIPMGRMGRPAEAAALIAWLASEDCSFSTGATYDLSGGRSTH
jgi:NAD(P)-dependent dehydrogenase (short-subunit alcohol dehydrogenase family)